MPELKNYISEEDYQHYDHVLKTNWSGLDVLDEHVYVRMFDYADKEDYYESVTIAEFATDIKVPTFCLGAADD